MRGAIFDGGQNKMGIINRMTREFRVRSEMRGAIFDGGQNGDYE